MESILSSVTKFFASHNTCKVYRPSTLATFYETIHLYNYNAEVSNKNFAADRIGSTDPGSRILPGDVLTFDDTGEKYIVSMGTVDRIFGGAVRKQLNLARVLEFVSIKSLVETVVKGYKQISTVDVATDVPFAYKRIEASESKEIRTVKNVYYGIFPDSYIFQSSYIVSTTFGDYTLLDSIPKEEGLAVWMLAEERANVI